MKAEEPKTIIMDLVVFLKGMALFGIVAFIYD